MESQKGDGQTEEDTKLTETEFTSTKLTEKGRICLEGKLYDRGSNYPSGYPDFSGSGGGTGCRKLSGSTGYGIPV